MITRGSVVAEEVPADSRGSTGCSPGWRTRASCAAATSSTGWARAVPTGAVVDRLRGFQRDEEDAAVDTAPLALGPGRDGSGEPYGAALDWPSVPSGRTASCPRAIARAGRRAPSSC
ncbi:hypothetical protein GS507_26190 [Rhodococcus hoagii]|nr:hypothetical protein [Prescottella equi]